MGWFKPRPPNSHELRHFPSLSLLLLFFLSPFALRLLIYLSIYLSFSSPLKRNKMIIILQINIIIIIIFFLQNFYNIELIYFFKFLCYSIVAIYIIICILIYRRKTIFHLYVGWGWGFHNLFLHNIHISTTFRFISSTSSWCSTATNTS